MSPSKTAFGRDARNPLTIEPTPEDLDGSDQSYYALEAVRKVKEVQDQARKTAQAAQKQQEVQANKKRRKVDFGVGDKVFLKKKGFRTTAPTTRLDSQWDGPHRIVEERGYSFVLDLPPGYKMTNLFHADRLRKASDNPLPQQVQSPPPPVELNGEPEWEVERIENSRIFGRQKTLQYQASWKGYDPDETWYPASNFKNSPTLLLEFHETNPDASGPPVRLQEWVRAAAADKEASDWDDDNKAVKEGKTVTVRQH